MSQRDPILKFDKPHFQVILHHDLLLVDLKEGLKHEIEKLAESRPVLRESVGWLFQTIIPLDVKLRDIDKAETGHDGRVHVRIPGRKDITIPLENAESQRLIEKLNELIPAEKARMYQERQESEARKLELEKISAKELPYTARTTR